MPTITIDPRGTSLYKSVTDAAVGASTALLADLGLAAEGVDVKLNDNQDGTASDGLGGTDVLRNIEAVRGSQFNDALTGGSRRSTAAAATRRRTAVASAPSAAEAPNWHLAACTARGRGCHRFGA